jgi:hypothetical protein
MTCVGVLRQRSLAVFGVFWWIALVGGLAIAALGRPGVYRMFFKRGTGSLDHGRD